MAENEKNPVVTMSTSMGDIRIELNADKAPISTKNFLDYVNEGHFDGLIFHRVIPGFMIQGGGFDSGMSQKKASRRSKMKLPMASKTSSAASPWPGPTWSIAPRPSFLSTLRTMIF